MCVCAPDAVSALCAQYATTATELQQSIKAIYPLKALLRRLYQHGHTELTPVHAQFFYLCLHAKCYSAAMEILNQYVSLSPVCRTHEQRHMLTLSLGPWRQAAL